MASKHEILISDPWNFEGPNGDCRLVVDGIGLVNGPSKSNWQGEYYLVELEQPFKIEGSLTIQFLCSPRYTQDSLEQVINGTCIVGIFRIKEGCSLSAGDTIQEVNGSYWGIGSITKIL